MVINGNGGDHILMLAGVRDIVNQHMSRRDALWFMREIENRGTYIDRRYGIAVYRTTFLV